MIKEEKRVLAKGERTLGLWWGLRNYCYSDEHSTDTFDAEHDNLVYQCDGLNETLDELANDIMHTEVTDKQLKSYEEEFDDNLEVIKKVNNWRKACLKYDNGFGYIYG